MLKLFLWLRYLRKRKIVLLSIAAVALSCALLIVVNSLFTGFIASLKQADISGMRDIILIPRMAPKYDILIDKIEQVPGVECASPFLPGGGLLRLGTGDVREAWICGVDAKRESKDSDLRQSLLRQSQHGGELSFDVPGYPNDIGGWVGIGVIAEPDEQTDEYDLQAVRNLIGKEVVLTTSGRVRVEPDTAGEEPGWEVKRKVLPFRISDIFYSGVYYKDKRLYVPYDDFYRLALGDEGETRAANVRIRASEGTEAVLLKPAVWRVWEQFASEELGREPDAISRAWIWVSEGPDEQFYAELRKQMAVLLLIFGVICSVTVLLIFCIFYMIVMTKQKDIAIIKSCGAASGSAAWIFMGFGICVGIVGSAFGIVLGYVVTKNINTLEDWVRIVFGMKLWRSSVYMFEKIPNEVNWSAVWWIVLAAVAACVIGSLIPAVVAARLQPVKILRYE
ncbi:MAG: FtsX-like permease family protein [Planctomycetota bacterium]|nr:MAG: FtsX-like permease family protein [Planctomycetota bacterium]